MISENCLEKNIQTCEKDGERTHFAMFWEQLKLVY
jgi:hypothetical protein